MVYQGFNLREIGKSRQFNLMTVKVMDSPATTFWAEQPWNCLGTDPRPPWTHSNPPEWWYDQPVHVCVRPRNLRRGCGGKSPKKRLTQLIFTRLYTRSRLRSIRPSFKLGDSTSGLKLSIHVVYQGLNPVHLAWSCQFNLGQVKVMGSPAEPGRAEAPRNWSKTPLITITNPPPPPLALPWSIRWCSHH